MMGARHLGHGRAWGPRQGLRDLRIAEVVQLDMQLEEETGRRVPGEGQTSPSMQEGSNSRTD